MTLLNRYILRSFVRIFALALGAFTGIYLLVDFFEKVDNLLEHQARAIHYLLYFGAKIPQIIAQVTPLGILLATFMTLGGFSRTNELTAMRAGGISLWRLSFPLLGAGLTAAVSVLALSEFVVPVTALAVNYTMDVSVKGKSEQLLKRENLWIREDQTIVHIALALPEEKTIEGVKIFRMDEGFRILSRIDASRALFQDGRWRGEDVIIRRFVPGTGEESALERLPHAALPLDKTPEDFQSSPGKNEELSFGELRHLARKLEAEGYGADRYRVDMQARLAVPFASLIMAFLGIPFALKKGRGSNLAAGIAIAVGVGVAYHIIQSLLLAFGYSSVLPPVVAAWAANVLFLLLGTWILLAIRD